MKDLKISLIVPTFNRCEYTEALLQNIIKYHQDDLFEIIFSDDGSDDDQSGILIKNVKDLRIPCKLVIQEHQGYRLARVRNNGVRQAEGDYLCFLDQDILPSMGYFRQIKKYAAPSRFLITRPIYTTFEEKERIFAGEDEKWFNEIYINGRFQLSKLVVKDFYYLIGKHLGIGDRRPKLQGGAFSLFKEQFIRVNGFDENFQGWGLEDDDLGRRLYVIKVFGLNISHKAWGYHLLHNPEPSKGLRVNREYYRKKIYTKNNFYVEKGLNCESQEKNTFIRIK